MTTKTICGCGHPISEHTYSEDFTGCDQSNCTCNLDMGAYIDNLNAELLTLRSDLEGAKARAKQAEENWHKNEARVAKLANAARLVLEWHDEDLSDGVQRAYVIRELRQALNGAE